MSNMANLHLPFSLALALAAFTGSAQTVYNVYQPENGSCETALSFCDDLVYNYFYTSGAPQMPCIYFVIDIQPGVVVHLNANGTQNNSNFKLNVTGPINPNNPCPEGQLLCNAQGNHSGSITTNNPGLYYVWGYFDGQYPGVVDIDVTEVQGSPCPEPCEECLPPFAPLPNEEYIVNAWVKKEGVPASTISYSGVGVDVYQQPNTLLETAQPVGYIIDGWQLLEGRFTMPSGSPAIRIELKCASGSALFDDVRVFPADGSMKSYVYDPSNLRYVAELDERHYATLYEYDAEGRLVRVKKETERGIMTIQESRQKSPIQAQ